MPLCHYNEWYFSSGPIVKLVEEVKKELKMITKDIADRNSKLELPYTYLSPDRIENSVTIWVYCRIESWIVTVNPFVCRTTTWCSFATILYTQILVLHLSLHFICMHLSRGRYFVSVLTIITFASLRASSLIFRAWFYSRLYYWLRISFFFLLVHKMNKCITQFNSKHKIMPRKGNLLTFNRAIITENVQKVWFS